MLAEPVASSRNVSAPASSPSASSASRSERAICAHVRPPGQRVSRQNDRRRPPCGPGGGSAARHLL
ncbi:hypothetical protein BJF78_34280 [Pseudonocardia sp. CNS-139]|nr:hypothetical protein BJF78_34280 [Pseudonocardia sp. CNS-139]